MKKILKKWLGIADLEIQLEKKRDFDESWKNDLERKIEQGFIGTNENLKYIGALYDYLEVRPYKTFIEDLGQLPQEKYPTREVVKVEKATKKKR